MTYNINIGGHLDTPEEETATLEKAKEFVDSLDGVNTANFSGMHSGSVSLLPQSTPDADETPAEEPAED